MTSFSDSVIELLIKGIPETFLFVWAVNVLTRTKFELKKYLTISIILMIITYLTRWLPISLGTHTMLVLLCLIFLYLITNKLDLQFIVKTITSIILIAIIVVVAEVLDMMLLTAIFGKITAESYFNSTSSLIRSVSALPSITIFGIIVLMIHLIMSKKDKKGLCKDGETVKKVGK